MEGEFSIIGRKSICIYTNRSHTMHSIKFILPFFFFFLISENNNNTHPLSTRYNILECAFLYCSDLNEYKIIDFLLTFWLFVYGRSNTALSSTSIRMYVLYAVFNFMNLLINIPRKFTGTMRTKCCNNNVNFFLLQPV